MEPPCHAVVLSIDEKSQIQALDRTQPGLPLKPGKCATMTHDYKRNGTTTLFAALNVLDGTVVGRCMKRHRHQEFIKFLNAVERKVPAGKIIHVILDNYGTHKHPKVDKWLANHPNRSSIYAHLRVLAECGRRLLLRHHATAHPARRLHIRRRPRRRHQALHPRSQPARQTLPDALLPDRRPEAEEASKDVGNALRLWLEGQFISMILVGLLSAAATWTIGLPSPLALGLIAGITEFIPYVGPVIAAIPAVLVAATQGTDQLLWTLAAYLAIHTPRVTSSRLSSSGRWFTFRLRS